MARRVLGRSFWSRLYLLFRTKGDPPKDLIVEEKSFTLGEAPASSTSRSGGSKRDPKLSIVKKVGLALSTGSGGAGRDFEPPEWDFNEITNAYNTEGYIRQAVDKYVEMMFKAGWKWVGKNPNAVEYVKMRFQLMAEATQIPTDQLFIEIAEDLVKFNNAIIAKARAKDNLPFQGMNVMGIGDSMPIAGYFPQPLAYMQVKRDKTGVVKGWQLEVEGQDKPVKFKPEDIVHIYYKREKGRAFATPWLLPALDDIRALRQMEENVLRLVYRNLHPFWHVQVGLDKEGLFGDDDEVDAVRAEIENMDIEGGLVTTERVKVQAIASNQIIDASAYLKYFEQRAFTVLGVSELMMGRGNTANRSTGDNLSGEFKDRIKAIQKVMSVFVNEFMVKEVLMEGGFDPVLNPDDAVEFRFNEIDMDSQIKAENQAVFLYEHNAITESEMRELIGRDPIEDGEQRAGMHLNVITIPTIQAEAAAQIEINAAKPTTGGSTGSLGSKAKTPSKKETDNKTKPANQHGVKASPKKSTNSIQYEKLLMAMFESYTTLFGRTESVLNTYRQTNSAEAIQALDRYFQSFYESTTHQIEHIYDTTILEQVDIQLQRLVLTLKNRVLDVLVKMEDLTESKEVLKANFDVFRDMLGAIATKSFEIYANKEV